MKISPTVRTIAKYAGLILSILMIVVGVLSLRSDSSHTSTLGVIILLAAVGLFLVTVRTAEKNPVEQDEVVKLKPYLIPVLFGTASLLFLIFAVYLLSNPQRPALQDRLVVASWMACLLCTVVGNLWFNHWHFPAWQSIKDWFKQNGWEILAVAGIVLVGLFLRMVILTQHPYPWSGDEASVGIDARRILQGATTDLFAAGWSGQPNWSFLPTSFAESIWGNTIFAVRMVSVIAGTLSILTVYLLGREVFNKTIAFMAAGFLAAFPFNLQFSRIGVNNIVDSLTVTFVLWLVFRAIRRSQRGDFLWAGMAAGLTIYTYVGSRLVLALAFFVLVYVIIRQRGFLKANLVGLGFFLFGILVTVTPMAFYFLQHPDIFMTRIGQENIFINHWLVLQSQRSGQSQLSLLWQQFKDTVLVFISHQAIGNFFNSSLPYLTVLGSIFFLFGMGFSFTHLLETRHTTLLVWFWAVVFLGGVFTTSPPANTRLVMTQPAIALFLAVGIFELIGILVKFKMVNATWGAIFSGILIVILGTQNIAFYFGPYRTSYSFQDANGELAMEAGKELQNLGPEYNYYLLGAPRVFAGFPTDVFLAPDNYMADLTSDSVPGFTLPAGKGAFIVAIPDNLADLQTIASRYPGGTWEHFERITKPEILYYAYILPPGVGH